MGSSQPYERERLIGRSCNVDGAVHQNGLTQTCGQRNSDDDLDEEFSSRLEPLEGLDWTRASQASISSFQGRKSVRSELLFPSLARLTPHGASGISQTNAYLGSLCGAGLRADGELHRR